MKIITLPSFLILLALVQSLASAAEPSALAVLEFEFIDELQDPRTADADRARLARSAPLLRELLASCPRYRVVDAGPASRAIERAQSQNAFLYRCNGCTQDIAQPAGADLVAFPWVQKVSNLIVNLNVEIRNAEDEVVTVKSIDLRGNTDRSWERGIKALAARLCPD
jgi:hypothetical protein